MGYSKELIAAHPILHGPPSILAGSIAAYARTPVQFRSNFGTTRSTPPG